MISKEEFEQAMTKERQQNQSNMDKILASIAELSNQLKTCNDNSKQFNDEVRNEICTVSKNLRDLHQSVDANRINFENKIVEVKGRVDKIQETVDNHNKGTADTRKFLILK